MKVFPVRVAQLTSTWDICTHTCYCGSPKFLYLEIPIPFGVRDPESGGEGGGEAAREARPNAREEEAAGGEEQTCGWTAGGG